MIGSWELAVERSEDGIYLQAGRTSLVIERRSYQPARGDKFLEVAKRSEAGPYCKTWELFVGRFLLNLERASKECVPMLSLADWLEGRGVELAKLAD